MLHRRSLLAAAGAAGLLPAWAQAQDAYPSRPIKFVLPYTAGGGTDVLARVLAQKLTERMRQTVVVDNRPGGGGNLATEIVAGSPADGYTLLMGNQGPMAVNPHRFKGMKVDPLTQLAPVTLIAAAPLVLVVPKDSAIKTVPELIAAAKAKPGILTYASAGNGSASHLAGALLSVETGIDITHVPYRGAAPALNDLLPGRVDMMLTTLPSVAGMIQQGQVRAIAVTSPKRVATLPDLPTIAEAGVSGYETRAWYGMLAPAGTPRPIIDRLRQEVAAAIGGDDLKTRLASEGAEPLASSPEEFAAFMKAESQKWAVVVPKAKITVD